MRRYKKRLKEHAAGSEPVAQDRERLEVANFLIEPPADDVADSPVDYSPVVVAEGAQPLKTMSVALAVLELDLTGAPVVVFQHATSSRINIVYRRRDGAIGWLDPR